MGRSHNKNTDVIGQVTVASVFLWKVKQENMKKIKFTISNVVYPPNIWEGNDIS